MKVMIRRFVVMCLVFVAAAVLPARTAMGASVSVSMGDNFYDPETVTISAGDTVVWTNNGQAPHTVTANDGSFDSSPDCPGDFDACMQSGDTYSQTFGAAGTFAYYCKVHGQEMSGTVVVQGGGTEPSESSPVPSGSLPNTGPGWGTLPFAVLGIALLAAGGAVLFLLRRRRA
jgi:LPXTG-motif cell wall-anchored protein